MWPPVCPPPPAQPQPRDGPPSHDYVIEPSDRQLPPPVCAANGRRQCWQGSALAARAAVEPSSRRLPPPTSRLQRQDAANDAAVDAFFRRARSCSSCSSCSCSCVDRPQRLRCSTGCRPRVRPFRHLHARTHGQTSTSACFASVCRSGCRYGQDETWFRPIRSRLSRRRFLRWDAIGRSGGGGGQPRTCTCRRKSATEQRTGCGPIGAVITTNGGCRPCLQISANPRRW